MEQELPELHVRIGRNSGYHLSKHSQTLYKATTVVWRVKITEVQNHRKKMEVGSVYFEYLVSTISSLKTVTKERYGMVGREKILCTSTITEDKHEDTDVDTTQKKSSLYPDLKHQHQAETWFASTENPVERSQGFDHREDWGADQKLFKHSVGLSSQLCEWNSLFKLEQFKRHKMEEWRKKLSSEIPGFRPPRKQAQCESNDLHSLSAILS